MKGRECKHVLVQRGAQNFHEGWPWVDFMLFAHDMLGGTMLESKAIDSESVVINLGPAPRSYSVSFPLLASGRDTLIGQDAGERNRCTCEAVVLQSLSRSANKIQIQSELTLYAFFSTLQFL